MLLVAFALVTRVLEELVVLLFAPYDWKRHRPGTGIELRIGHRRFVFDGVGIDEREPLDEIGRASCRERV